MAKVIVFDLQIPHLNAIEKLGNLITLALFLKFIDPNLPLWFKIDVKSEGLEALFEQSQGFLETPEWHPIGYSSRVLSDYKKRFARIERIADSYGSWSGTFPETFIWSKICHH